MKFDINIDYTIDLDKCNAQAYPEDLKLQNEVKEENKIKTILLNFVRGSHTLVFIENDIDMYEFKSLIRKLNYFKKTSVNEYYVNNERKNFYKDLLKRLMNGENKNAVILRTFNFSYISNYNPTENIQGNDLLNKIHTEAIKQKINDINKLFFKSDITPNIYVELLDDGSCKVYSEKNITTMEEIKTSENFKYYISKIPQDKFYSLFWNEFPFININLNLNECNIKFHGFDLTRAVEWCNSFTSDHHFLREIGVPGPKMLISALGEPSNLLIEYSPTKIEFYGLECDVKEYRKKINE